MPFSSVQKNNINLSDYNYQEDINNRLLMSNLTFFEVDVLKELINGSLKNSIENLAETLDTSEDEIVQAVNKLLPSKLMVHHQGTLTINKNVRKYYETQIVKFEEDFRPDMAFLQGILNKVPIEVLPTWYSLPKHANNIFQSIVEKFLATPKIYMTYVAEIQLENPIYKTIIKELYSTPDLTLPVSALLSKFSWSKLELEEHLLMLEFQLICCLSYRKKGSKWEEVISPYHEWKEFCLNDRKKTPSAIQDEKKISRLAASTKQSYSQALSASPFYTSRNLLEIERSLKKNASHGWIYLDDFLHGCTFPISNRENILLKNKGKRWEYQLPSHTQDEKDFIKQVLTDRFLELGLIEIGMHMKKPCFALTNLGKKSMHTHDLMEMV